MLEPSRRRRLPTVPARAPDEATASQPGRRRCRPDGWRPQLPLVCSNAHQVLRPLQSDECLPSSLPCWCSVVQGVPPEQPPTPREGGGWPSSSGPPRKRGGNGFLFVYVRARWLYSCVLAVVEVPVLSSGDSLRGSSVAHPGQRVPETCHQLIGSSTLILLY
jgi:hypothetical protein